MHQSRNRAYTLVEVLIVVAVILLLVGVMLPALLAGRRSGDKVACVSNARQVALAWSLYSHDSGERLVINVDGMTGGFTNWVPGNKAFRSDTEDERLLVDPRRSLLGPYVKNPSLFRCPSDEERFVRSISMNCRMNPFRADSQAPRWTGGLGDRFQTFRKVSDLSRPAETFLTTDESADTINDAYFAVDMSNTGSPDGTGSIRPYYLIDYPAARHSRGATISFADNHVEVHKWQERTTVDGIKPITYVGQSADAEWLQMRSTQPK